MNGYKAIISRLYIEAINLFPRRKARNQLSVIAEIMEIAKEGILKTQLMYKANLGFHQLNEYISFLLRTKLLEVTTKGRHKIYKTSEKGLLYLDNYQKIGAIMEGAIGEREVKGSLESIVSEIKRIKRSISTLEINLARQGQCPDCGKEIFPDFRLCPYCGKELLEAPKMKMEESA